MNNIMGNKFLQRSALAVTLCVCVLSLPKLVQSQTAETRKVDDPVAVMKIAIENVLAQLKTHEELYQSDPEQLRSIVAKSALPNIYVKRMGQLALAKHWRNANAQQRETYLHEFQRYLIRSYTRTLYAYRNTKPEMLGINSRVNKKGYDESKDTATLKLRVESDHGKSTMLFLRLEFHDDNWKIVDINVEGISLVVTARGVFDEEINRVGLGNFLKKLAENNNKTVPNEEQ